MMFVEVGGGQQGSENVNHSLCKQQMAVLGIRNSIVGRQHQVTVVGLSQSLGTYTIAL